MRRLALVTAASLGMLVSSAGAADRPVGISVFEFRPDAMTINPGDSVTWRWNGPDTNHSVTAVPGEAEPFDSDPDRALDGINHGVGATFQHTFTRGGVYHYRCSVHPRFMRGIVTVRAVPDHEAPRIHSLRIRPPKVCTRRTRDCPRPGARLGFTLSERATVSGRLRRIGMPRSQGHTPALSMTGRRGRNEVRLAARRLRKARYRIELTATDAVGNVSQPARTGFAVK